MNKKERKINETKKKTSSLKRSPNTSEIDKRKI